MSSFYIFKWLEKVNFGAQESCMSFQCQCPQGELCQHSAMFVRSDGVCSCFCSEGDVVEGDCACQALWSQVFTRRPLLDKWTGLSHQGQLESSRWNRRGKEESSQVGGDEPQNSALSSFRQEGQMFLFSVLFCSVQPGQISKQGGGGGGGAVVLSNSQ